MNLCSPCRLRPAPLRAATAALLSVVLTGQPMLAAVAPSTRLTPANQMVGAARILHALNRFTFGPRPGEIDAVRAMGLKAWFDRQLNPSSIDDSALDDRLAAFPAMLLSQAQLMARFPSPQLLRATEKQNLPLPSDPVQHALYADGIGFYEIQQARKAAAGANGGAAAKDGMATMAGNEAAPPTHEDSLYSGLEAVKVINLSPDARMHRLLTMSPQELIAFRSSLTPQELAAAGDGLSPEQKEILAALPGSQRMIAGEVLQTRLLRDIYSDRELEAVMTDFWLNHFNVYLKKNQNEPYLLPAFERDVVRPRALGNFEDLLVATAKSPAMLMYLDNWQSVGPDSDAARRAEQRQQRAPDAKVKAANGLNENYARELMELHTLGVNGGYTQADVTQVAKVFTGWTIEKPFRGASYEFEGNRHEPGDKQVLGVTIHDRGEDEGLQVLHMLATSPATAQFISSKLAVRFVSDDPPPALVDRMTKAFLASHGDIKTVLRAMFDSPEFWAPAVERAKVKTPLEFLVSAVRASDARVRNAQPLVQALDKLGMPLYGMQTPNGYSWLAEPWVSTGALVSRMNFALTLTGDRLPGVATGLASLLDGPASVQSAAYASQTGDALEAKEKRLEMLLLGGPVSDRTRETVLRQADSSAAQKQAEKEFAITLNDAGQLPAPLLNVRAPEAASIPKADAQTATMAGLLLGSPEFQRR